MVDVRKLHEKYGGRAQFLFVYVSDGGHELPEELRPFAEPPGAPEGSRLRLLPRVRAGKKHFHLDFPCLIDNERYEVEALYRGYPARMIIVNSTGHIALDSGAVSLESSFWKRASEWFDRQGTSPSP